MPECTCRGANPNCFKCGGWGWLGDQVARNRAGRLDVRVSPTRSPKKKRRKSLAGPNGLQKSPQAVALAHSPNSAHPKQVSGAVKKSAAIVQKGPAAGSTKKTSKLKSKSKKKRQPEPVIHRMKRPLITLKKMDDA